MGNSAAGGRSPLGLFLGQPTPRLYDCVVEALRSRHYSRRTEEAYLHWIRRFLAFHNSTHPRQFAEKDLNRFLTHLAISENVAASTQNQALAALLFLYQHVLEQPLDRIEGVVRARKPKRLPVVLTRDEAQAILTEPDGVPRLVCALLYGAGLRLLEGLALRVKDLGFGRGQITVRQGKGQKDGVSMLPGALLEALQDHLRRVRQQHEVDLKSGLGQAPLPEALARKYPNAAREWGWQWLFPASSHYLDRKTGIRHRHHLHESVIQKAVHQAARRVGLTKRVTTHAFRHSFATHLLEDGYDIRTVQELLGHKDVQTTMVYTHVLNRGGRGVRSPLDGLQKAVSSEGRIRPAGRPKTGGKFLGYTRSGCKHDGCRAGWPRRFRLRLPRTGFIQVGLNKSSAGRGRPAERAAAEPSWLRPPAAAEPAAGTDGPLGHGSAAAR